MQDFVEIAHPAVEVTALVHPRSVEAHRRAGWAPVGEHAPADTTDPQPDPAGDQDDPVAGESEHTEE
ncbi:hypothetical protein ACTHAM_002356 [Cellulomonas soli]|uniref:hypothetical protein n=1 Tax=Cellulomonas soli TaxID=931535 RepID=UPI003F86081C